MIDKIWVSTWDTTYAIEVHSLTSVKQHEEEKTENEGEAVERRSKETEGPEARGLRRSRR